MRNLNKLYFIKLEIENLKKEISNLTYIGSPALNGMPFSGGVSSPIEQYLIKKEHLIEKLNKTLEKYMDEYERIQEEINNISDTEIRLIARYRYIDNLKWEDIGYKMNYDRSVCSKKLKKYMESRR